ncbi:putative nad dependent epimerase dehydratase family protein [Ilyonectria robusta]
MSPPLSLLLTGASGFVGGTVFSQLLNSSNEIINSLSITTLVREESQANVLQKNGIKSVILPRGLDDTEGLTKLASQFDVVLHTATGFHPESAKALIAGLAMRGSRGDFEPVFIQLSGTTNLSVGDVTGHGGKCLTFSDNDEGIFEYELEREALRKYSQRTTDVTVVETGERLSIRTYIIMPPLVWGRGTGYFNTGSQQIPMLIRNAISAGRSEYVAPGTSALGHVHVLDLATLFEAVIARAVVDPSLPAGRKGYFFAGTGRHSWKEVADRIAGVGVKLHVLKDAEATPINLTDAAAKFWNGDEIHTERIQASSSQTRAEKGYELGWQPTKTEHEWQACIQEAFQMVLDDTPN